MPGTPPRTVYYTAAPVTAYRILVTAVGAVPVLLLGGGCAMALFAGPAPVWPVALVLALLCAFLAVAVARGGNHRFRVTDVGVELYGTLSTRRIAWADVAVVEVERNLVGRGGTVVVTRTGRRHRSAITEARSALQRGESTADHGQDLLWPARPTQAAVAAHQQYLTTNGQNAARP